MISEIALRFEGYIKEMKLNLPKIYFIQLILLSLLFSCQEKSFDPEDPADVFARASEPYEDGLFDIALQKLGEFKSRFPYSKHATKAELMMADSHFQLGNFQESAFAYEQFIKLHPRHEKIDFALYRVGESYWIEAPEAIDREQEYTQKAVNEWSKLLKRFPKSEFASSAKEKTKKGLKRIAESNVFVMKFYWKQKKYHSCAYKALKILEKYKSFPKLRKEALKLAGLSFKELAEQKRKDPDTDANVYVRSMTTEELEKKAKTFTRLYEAS